MAHESVSLSYFVRHYRLPAAVRVLSGSGQLEEGDEVTLQSVQSTRGVEAFRGRHGENLTDSYIPFKYNGIFEVIVASASQPWASYRDFPTVGSVIRSGRELPLAVKARNAWRGSTECNSVYQNDVLTSLTLKVDGTGRTFLEAINGRGLVINLHESVRGDFTTDLSDVHWSIDEMVKLFEAKFPVRVRLRATPSVYDTIGSVGDIFTLLRVTVRQEVMVIGIGDNFQVIADDSVDVIMLDSTPGAYTNIEAVASSSYSNHYHDDRGLDDPLYTPMANPSPEIMQSILRSHKADHKAMVQNLNETIENLKVKLVNEQSKNNQLETKIASLETELQVQALRYAQERQHGDEIRILKATVEQLQIKNQELESKLRFQAEHKQRNHDINETVVPLGKYQHTIPVAMEGPYPERQEVTSELTCLQTGTIGYTDFDQPTRKPSSGRISSVSPIPKPRERISKSDSNPLSPPLPQRKPVSQSPKSSLRQSTPPIPAKRNF
ncbi:uncharacterized protein LOC134180431 [Corticium candelabrum]|uniref:uncharacterized protein LOC134180431 n=1 Tax=Corticium candelabrum TaxID=121492 RepID=UPI002E273B60|nr:uncharacterized protein LOC134180431 [Corticium candelabrum]